MTITKKILKSFGITFINDYIKSNDLESIKRVGKINLETSDYLINAINENNIEIVNYLLSIGANKHYKYNMIIADSILNNVNNDIIITLLDKLENFNEDIFTFDFSLNSSIWHEISILECIIKLNNLELLNYILEKGNIDFNKKINTKWSMLMYCIYYDNKVMFDLLLNNGAIFFNNNYENLKFVFSNQITFLDYILKSDLIIWEKNSLNVLEKKINKNFKRLNLKIVKDFLNFFDSHNYSLKQLF